MRGRKPTKGKKSKTSSLQVKWEGVSEVRFDFSKCQLQKCELYGCQHKQCSRTDWE